MQYDNNGDVKMTKLPFVCLPANEQARARAMFFDARPHDGYLYELCGGRVLCRNRSALANQVPRKNG